MPRPSAAADRLACQVVVGRAETAGEHDEVGALQRRPDGDLEMRELIADDAAGDDVDAERGQPRGDHPRVRVGAAERQQFAADGNRLGTGERRGVTRASTSGHQPGQQAHAHVRVDGGHEVVAHDAPAAVQFLEPVAGRRLDHVEHPEQDEADQRARQRHGDQGKRDQHAEHLVDHDRARIDVAEMRLGGRGRPGAGQEDDRDGRELHGGVPDRTHGRHTPPGPPAIRTCRERTARSRCRAPLRRPATRGKSRKGVSSGRRHDARAGEAIVGAAALGIEEQG